MLDEKTIRARISGERQRAIENILARTERPAKIWWLSFADEHKPRGSQFLGVVIIHANDFIEAITESHMLNINPGGQCQGMLIARPDAINLIDEGWKGRLLDKDECEALDKEMQERLKIDVSIYEKPPSIVN